MDPNEALGQIRRIADSDDYGDVDLTDMGENELRDVMNQFRELSSAISALDSWLSAGGFLPRAWQDNRK